jgi:alpha-tubulin suppressor-like RCC1 family protein
MNSSWGIKVDAVVAYSDHMMARAEDGSVYTWGDASGTGALGLGPTVNDAEGCVPTPQRIPELRVSCGL